MEIDKALLARAVEAIVRHENKKSASKNTNALFEDYPKPILLSIQLTSPITKAIDRPVRVKIPHSLYADDGSNSLCMFCRTEDKAEFEALMQNKSIPGLTSVISMKEVKRDYKAITDRKKLLTSHTHFLCDPSILTQLYNCLGNTFSKRNKYPVPIKKYTSFDKVPVRVMDALTSTYMHMRGDVISVRMAHTGMSLVEIVDNVQSGIVSACEKLPDEWRSVHSLHIKSADSAALPIYSKAKNDYVVYAKGLAGVEDKSKGKKAVKAVAPATAKPAAPAKVGATPVKSTPKKLSTPAPEPEPKAVLSVTKKTPNAKATAPKSEVVAEEPSVATEAPKGKKTPAKKAVPVVVEKLEAPPTPEIKSAKKAVKSKKSVALEPVPEDKEVVPPASSKKRPVTAIEDHTEEEARGLRRGRSASR